MTHMITRILKDKLARSPKSILLLGPRQVGKRTVCNQLRPDLTINLADEREFQAHLKDAGLLARIIEAHPPESLILVDEVQRIPTILNSIQAMIDSVRERKFLITGSSARKLKRGQANLLPGRVFLERLSPLLFWEIKDQLNLERALQLGGLPEVYLNDYGPRLLDSYIDSYLREEIQAEAATKDLGAYARFLDLAAELSGQYLNYSKIASDSEIKKETVRRYFSILEDTLLVERIPSFTEVNWRRKARQKDRFIFFDLGVRNALLRKHTAALTKTEMGALFEQWICLQVLYYSRLYNKPWRLASFGLLDGQEIDLVIDTGKALIAVEIKFRDRIDVKMTKGLLLFEELTKRPTKKIIVYTGMHRQQLPDAIQVMPYKDFLSELESLS